MSLLSTTVARRSREARLYVALIYALLVSGGVTMIYPFLVMISGSFKSEVDLRDWDVVPKYFYSDDMLFRKYVESKFNESVSLYNSMARQGEYAFTKVEPPAPFPPGRTDDWHAWLAKADLPATWTILGHSSSVNARLFPRHARGFRASVVAKCDGDIHEYHRRYGSLVASWLNVVYPAPVAPPDRAYKITGSPIQAEALRYLKAQPVEDLLIASLDGRYVTDFLQLKYSKAIGAYNAAHGTSLADWSGITLTAIPPPDGKAREDWLEFIRTDLNLQFVRVDATARPAFAVFLRSRYERDLKALNRAYGTRYPTFAEVPYPDDAITVGSALVDWEIFIREAPASSLSVDGPDLRWRTWLKARYEGKLAGLNVVHGASYPSFDAVPMPVKEACWSEMKARPTGLRWEFAVRNYLHVFQYLALHGRGLFNTLVLCTLSILSVLIVNPVAAYAMSRYNLPSTYKILLFLLATIAFPPMVTAIPNFLLLKQLGLLNTFFALVLPGMVNGYAIFLLKGFFDSLPRELYEAAQIDGAGETTMFWLITMNLSKPILAVIALDAFNAAYGAFMYAFIVCQDEKMWTLGVWLYQLQQYAHQSVTFAALLVASIPTFLVFILAQRIILQGIVIPIEK